MPFNINQFKARFGYKTDAMKALDEITKRREKERIADEPYRIRQRNRELRMRPINTFRQGVNDARSAMMLGVDARTAALSMINYNNRYNENQARRRLDAANSVLGSAKRDMQAAARTMTPGQKYAYWVGKYWDKYSHQSNSPAAKAWRKKKANAIKSRESAMRALSSGQFRQVM